MASPAFRSAGALYRLSGTNSVAVPNAAGAVAGDLLVLVLFTIFSNQANDVAANGWTQVQDYDPNNADFSQYSIFWRIATGSEPATYPVVISGGSGAQNLGDAMILCYQGPIDTPRINVSTQATGASSTSINIPSVTTTRNDTTLVALYGDTALNGAGAWGAVPTGMAQRTTTPSFAVADMEVPAAGATGVKVATHASPAPWAALVMAISGYIAPGANIDLGLVALSGGSTVSTGAVTVTPPVAGVVNLAGSNITAGSTISTAVAAISTAVGTVTTEPFKAWGSPAPLVGLSIPHVTVQRMASGVQVLNLLDQVTDGLGRLVLVNSAMAAGSWYMVGSWNADGSSRGFKAYLAT